jgi:hypothetical protein
VFGSIGPQEVVILLVSLLLAVAVLVTAGLVLRVVVRRLER